MTFGQTIARHRKQKMMTQERVAAMLHISARELNDIERDVIDPNTVMYLEELASIVHAPIDELRILAQHHVEDARRRRMVEAEENFSMLTLRRSRE